MKKKILVVDDEADVVACIKFILEMNGFEVVTAYDGEEGLIMAQEHIPDLILLDILMPKIYGNTLASRLEQDPHTEHIPVIYLSALVQKEGDHFKRDMWGRLLLPKTCTEQELVSAISEAFTA